MTDSDAYNFKQNTIQKLHTTMHAGMPRTVKIELSWKLHTNDS